LILGSIIILALGDMLKRIFVKVFGNTDKNKI